MPETSAAPVDNSPMGWASFFRQLADRYGLPAVALLVITAAIFWQGNKWLEQMRSEQAEDKRYFRGEFKTIVDNNTRALQEVTTTRQKIVESMEENTLEVRALREELTHSR